MASIQLSQKESPSGGLRFVDSSAVCSRHSSSSSSFVAPQDTPTVQPRVGHVRGEVATPTTCQKTRRPVDKAMTRHSRRQMMYCSGMRLEDPNSNPKFRMTLRLAGVSVVRLVHIVRAGLQNLQHGLRVLEWSSIIYSLKFPASIEISILVFAIPFLATGLMILR